MAKKGIQKKDGSGGMQGAGIARLHAKQGRGNSSVRYATEQGLCGHVCGFVPICKAAGK